MRVALILLLALLAFPLTAQTRVRVTSVEDLLRNIGPRREIVLAAGTYDLAEAPGVQSRWFTWREVFDGREAVVKGVAGLRLRGEAGALILARPRYSFVLAFEDCEDITLENLVLGHSEGGSCTGGVLSFTRTSRAVVRACELYGSGTIGVVLEKARDFTLGESLVRDCTQGALQAVDSQTINLIGSTINANQASPLFDFANTGGVRFSDCRIANNAGSVVFMLDARSTVTGLARCVFESNAVEVFAAEGGAWPNLDEAVFSDNAFADPTAGMGEGDGGGGADFEVPAAGLRMSLPVGWNHEMYDGGREGVTFESPDRAVFGFLIQISEATQAGMTPAGRKQAFSSAYEAFRAKLADKLGMPLALQEDGEPFAGGGLLRQAYRGRVRQEALRLAARLQLLLHDNGRTHALAIFAVEPAAESYEPEFEFVFDSVRPSGN